MLKEQIIIFIKEMERILQETDLAKCDSWEICSFDFLFDKGREEEEGIEELERDLYYSDWDLSKINVEKLKKKLVDRANICMMLWNRLNNETHK